MTRFLDVNKEAVRYVDFNLASKQSWIIIKFFFSES